MGRKRRKEGARRPKRGGKPGQQGAATPALAEAVRRGKHGQFLRAVRLAREAVGAASSADERLAAERVLAEAHLHAALAAPDATDVLAHLDRALRADPASARLNLYRALSLLQLGKIEEGRAALEQSLRGGELDLAADVRHAQQLARLATGRGWAEAGLSESARVELGLVAALLAVVAGNGTGAAAPQLSLFPSRPGEDACPLEDTRVWRALLALAGSASAAPVAELRDAHETAPPPARARIRYYEAVAELRQGGRDQAAALLRSLSAGGLDTPWLRHNLVVLLRESVQDLARQGRWHDVVRLADEVLDRTEDRILGETVALAHDHLAHDDADSGRWSEAARHWRRSEALHPRRQVAQNLALAEEALGDWTGAARAWRAMARRRPRRRDHPDYLPDDQVAALWSHAAECYERAADEEGEVGLDDGLTCIETALKYAPEDPELRYKRAELLYLKDSNDAAARELDALLEVDPSHLEALKLRAAVENEDPAGDSTPFLRRGLRIAPRDADLREALAASYLSRTERPSGFLATLVKPLGRRERMRLLEEGLGEVPGHPGLLAALGSAYREDGKLPKARETLRRALEASGRDRARVGEVLHELVHAADREEAAVLDVLPRVRDLDALPPQFWIAQAEGIADCSLPSVWFERFLDEALALVGRQGVGDSRASVLYRAWEVAGELEGGSVARRLEKRIREEESASGAVELMQAAHLALDGEPRRARARLSEARRRARRAGDRSLLEIVEARQVMLSPAGNLLRMFEEIIG